MSEFPNDPKSNSHIVHDIAPAAIGKVVFAVVAGVILMKIFTIGLLIFLGFILAVSLEPIVQKLKKHGFSKGLAVTTIALSMTGIIGLISLVLIPSIYNQVTTLIQSLPVLRTDILINLPSDNIIRKVLGDALKNPKIPSPDILVTHAFSFVNIVFESLSEIFLVLIFSIYLLLDGKRAFKWFCDFFSSPVRTKLVATGKETTIVVHAYVRAQLLTSLLGAISSYFILKPLNVPGALTLSVLAGLLDVLPVIGFFLAVIPAMLLALSISPGTAGAVLALYLLYHTVENYFVVPYVYGNSLKVSSLVILAALLIAGSLGGVLAAMAILPVVASYPIIERIWLVKYLGRQVVTKHSEATEATEVAEQVRMWNEKLINLTRISPSYSERRTLKDFRKTVLIVEDDPDIRATLKDALEIEGHRALVAANGRDGLDILHKRSDVGLIFLDMDMPIMNGRTFLEKVKMEADLRDIPVIFLSGNPDPELSPGAVDYLRKPAELDAVLDLVSKHYRI